MLSNSRVYVRPHRRRSETVTIPPTRSPDLVTHHAPSSSTYRTCRSSGRSAIWHPRHGLQHPMLPSAFTRSTHTTPPMAERTAWSVGRRSRDTRCMANRSTRRSAHISCVHAAQMPLALVASTTTLRTSLRGTMASFFFFTHKLLQGGRHLLDPILLVLLHESEQQCLRSRLAA